jgi:Rrf2 family protein
MSEAAALAIHTAVLLASNEGRPVSTREVAEELHASEAHLSKVLQRLTKQGLVRSIRGPKGGFVLTKPGEDLNLIQVYEAIEGPLEPSACLFEREPCNREKCLMGGLLAKVNRELRTYLSGTRVADLREN